MTFEDKGDQRERILATRNSISITWHLLKTQITQTYAIPIPAQIFKHRFKTSLNWFGGLFYFTVYLLLWGGGCTFPPWCLLTELREQIAGVGCSLWALRTYYLYLLSHLAAPNLYLFCTDCCAKVHGFSVLEAWCSPSWRVGRKGSGFFCVAWLSRN